MNPTEEAIKGLMDEWKSQRLIFRLPDTPAMRLVFALGAQYSLNRVAEYLVGEDLDGALCLIDAITAFATSTIDSMNEIIATTRTLP